MYKAKFPESTKRKKMPKQKTYRKILKVCSVTNLHDQVTKVIKILKLLRPKFPCRPHPYPHHQSHPLLCSLHIVLGIHD